MDKDRTTSFTSGVGFSFDPLGLDGAPTPIIVSKSLMPYVPGFGGFQVYDVALRTILNVPQRCAPCISVEDYETARATAPVKLIQMGPPTKRKPSGKSGVLAFIPVQMVQYLRNLGLNLSIPIHKSFVQDEIVGLAGNPEQGQWPSVTVTDNVDTYSEKLARGDLTLQDLVESEYYKDGAFTASSQFAPHLTVQIDAAMTGEETEEVERVVGTNARMTDESAYPKKFGRTNFTTFKPIEDFRERVMPVLEQDGIIHRDRLGSVRMEKTHGEVGTAEKIIKLGGFISSEGELNGFKPHCVYAEGTERRFIFTGDGLDIIVKVGDEEQGEKISVKAGDYEYLAEWSEWGKWPKTEIQEGDLLEIQPLLKELKDATSGEDPDFLEEFKNVDEKSAGFGATRSSWKIGSAFGVIKTMSEKETVKMWLGDYETVVSAWNTKRIKGDEDQIEGSRLEDFAFERNMERDEQYFMQIIDYFMGPGAVLATKKITVEPKELPDRKMKELELAIKDELTPNGVFPSKMAHILKIISGTPLFFISDDYDFEDTDWSLSKTSVDEMEGKIIMSASKVPKGHFTVLRKQNAYAVAKMFEATGQSRLCYEVKRGGNMFKDTLGGFSVRSFSMSESSERDYPSWLLTQTEYKFKFKFVNKVVCEGTFYSGEFEAEKTVSGWATIIRHIVYCGRFDRTTGLKLSKLWKDWNETTLYDRLRTFEITEIKKIPRPNLSYMERELMMRFCDITPSTSLYAAIPPGGGKTTVINNVLAKGGQAFDIESIFYPEGALAFSEETDDIREMYNKVAQGVMGSEVSMTIDRAMEIFNTKVEGLILVSGLGHRIDDEEGGLSINEACSHTLRFIFGHAMAIAETGGSRDSTTTAVVVGWLLPWAFNATGFMCKVGNCALRPILDQEAENFKDNEMPALLRAAAYVLWDAPAPAADINTVGGNTFREIIFGSSTPLAKISDIIGGRVSIVHENESN